MTLALLCKRLLIATQFFSQELIQRCMDPSAMRTIDSEYTSLTRPGSGSLVDASLLVMEGCLSTLIDLHSSDDLALFQVSSNTSLLAQLMIVFHIYRLWTSICIRFMWTSIWPASYKMHLKHFETRYVEISITKTLIEGTDLRGGVIDVQLRVDGAASYDREDLGRCKETLLNLNRFIKYKADFRSSL